MGHLHCCGRGSKNEIKEALNKYRNAKLPSENAVQSIINKWANQ